jgi:hypothetical protein
VARFVADGRSSVHTLITSPETAGVDTQRSFQDIAAAGKGTCSDLQDHERVLRRILGLAFGREFDRDLTLVEQAVAAATDRVDTRSLDLVRRGGAPLLAALRTQPVPDALLNACVRRPRRQTMRELVAALGQTATPPHSRQAIAWVLQRVLDLPLPPIEPVTATVPIDVVPQLRDRTGQLPD